MSSIHEDLGALEQHIAALNKHAGKATERSMEEGRQFLGKIADKIKSPGQSKNNTYYNLGKPEVYEVGDKAPKPVTVSAAELGGLTFDTFHSNNTVALQILAKAEETFEKIDKLAAAGKKFNAAKAKADVHAVTAKVAGILRETDLTAAWVQEDLRKLASRADQLHGLFASAKA